jgi:hypothetical protein
MVSEEVKAQFINAFKTDNYKFTLVSKPVAGASA